ncbi:MAG: two-component regulator propeller domain-containing protein [Ignavibacteriaceae bacterium]
MNFSYRRYNLPVVLVIMCAAIVSAQPDNIRFEHFTTDDGLSSNHTSYIFQDSKGFLWITTEDGINRYDGYKFKHYKHIPGNINSLSDYAATHILEDSKGLFWISTREGLNVFDPSTEKFTHYKPLKGDSASLSNEKIVYTAEDKFGNIWVGTRNGLNLFHPEANSFTVFTNNPDDKHSLSFNYVTSFFNDSKGNFWIGTQRGLNKFNYDSKSFEVYSFDQQNPESLSGNLITCFLEDSKGNLWIGTSSGLNKLLYFVNDVPVFKRYLYNASDENSLSNNNIRSIAEDSKGNLWIGTLGGGINIFNTAEKQFTRYLHNEDDNTSLSDNIIFSILIDKNDNVWIGTYENGINKYSPTRERFIYFQPQPDTKSKAAGNNITAMMIDNNTNLWLGTEDDGIKVYRRDLLFIESNPLYEFKSGINKKETLSSNNITSIVQDDNGKIFIGTFGGGLNVYDPDSRTFEVFRYNRNDPGSLGNDFIHTVYKDSENTIWIGTGLAGLNRFDDKTGSFKRYRDNIKSPDDPKYLNSPEVTSVCEDNEGYLWVGTTTGGLSRFDPKSETFTHFKHEQQDARSISSNRIVSLHYDKQNSLWIGTFGGGLNLFNKVDNTFIHYQEKDGLPDNTIKAICDDNEGNLYLTTSNGISIFNPDQKIFKNYDESDGLQGKDFNQGSMVRDSISNTVYFGGIKGLNIYSAELDYVSVVPPEIALTEFKIFDTPVLHNYPSLSKKEINANDKVVLSHSDNIISFEYAALDYTSPTKNQYAYKLEGFDKDWIYAGNKREVSYTNLDPGSYIFKVKASNKDGLWNETGLSVPFIIEPPFWKTWWAYSVYVLLIAAGFLSIRRYELNRIHLRNKLRLKEFESTNLLEVNKIKSTFFANISHEFRTPLTIILGSLEKLKKDMIGTSDIKEFEVMKRNAFRLLQLINQLLELSKIESGNVKLGVTENDIVIFIKRIAASFTSLAYQKNQTIFFNGTEIENAGVNEEILLYFDKKKLETVFYNLLSNAIKFSPEGETLKIKIFKQDEFIKIDFVNTGIEIPTEKFNRVFDRFYQVEDSGSRNFEGTGIGLALAKEYLELHKGKIEVESGNNETTFSVYLRSGNSHFNPDQINSDGTEEHTFITEVDIPQIFVPETLESESVEVDRTSILIVEDNFDLREMIKENLKNYYLVLEADNGKTGFAIAEEKIPDLIISDIMMPEMNGYELSRLIKSNEKTNHIPVILLTAKASTEDKIEGLETGADDYLIKPFNEQELKIRVRNLIKIRQQMREKYQSQMLIKPNDVLVPSAQKVFISNLTSIIEKNISNEQFSVEILCQKIGMSRAQLHRKIKAVTNQSTSEFIRNFKLRRAAELLKQDAGNIAEICYMVGFNSQNYFTKMFHNLYGKTPLEYKKEHTK